MKHATGLLRKIKFFVFMVRRFFLLSHFLVVEDDELSKSASHLLNVLLYECVRILSRSLSFFFYFSCLPDDVLCTLSELMIPISTHHVTNHLSCCNKFIKSLWIAIWSYKLNFLEKISILYQLLFDFKVSRFSTAVIQS